MNFDQLVEFLVILTPVVLEYHRLHNCHSCLIQLNRLCSTKQWGCWSYSVDWYYKLVMVGG